MKIRHVRDVSKIIVFQGGSGSGKTSLCRMLTDRGIPKIVTCTTRRPKEGEVDGKDYFFILSEKNFLKLDLIEHQEYSGNLYGTTRREIECKLRDYKVICTIMEQVGAKTLKEAYPDNVIIVSLPISEDYMLANMVKRHETNEEIINRLKTAKELGEDKPVDFADYVIDGNDLERKWTALLNIIKSECNVDLK